MKTHAQTTARVVAFVLVAPAALGLAYLHFASGDDRVSVPAGAREGQLTLKPCMEFAEASRFADRHDVVLVGYRGVDGSTALDCPEVSSALKRSADAASVSSMFLATTSNVRPSSSVGLNSTTSVPA